MIRLQKSLGLIAVLLLTFTVYSQEQKLDSLRNVLQNTDSKKTKVDVYNDIAFRYIYIKFDSIKPNANKAMSLAKEIKYPSGVATAKKNLSVYYYFKGDRQKSLDNIYSALAIFKVEKDSVGTAKAYNNLATLYKNFGELNQSLKAFDTAISYNEKLKLNQGLINNYINAAGIYVKQGDYDKAIATYKTAEELNTIEQDPGSEASIKSGLGMVSEDQGRFDDAISLFEESLVIFEQLDKTRNIVAMANNIGNIAQKKGDYLKSIEYFNRALISAKQINNRRLEAIILNNLANNYLEINDSDKALELYKESAEIIEGIDDYAYAASISNIALILQDTNGEASLKYLTKANTIYKKMDSKPNLINNLNNLANYYYSIGDYQLAKSTYLEAKNVLKNVDTDYLKSSTWLGLSNTNLALGAIDSAQIYVEEALKLARKTQALSEEAESVNLIYKIAKINNNPTKALEYLELHEVLSDSLFNAEKSKALGKLEAELEFKNLNAKLALERANEKRETSLQLQARKNWIIALLAIVIGLSLIVILLYFIEKNKSKTNKRLKTVSDQLKEKNEKLKQLHIQKNRLISIISHDFRGPLNSFSQFLEMYINKQITKEEFDAFAPEINQRISSTQKLIDNLMNWAKQSLNVFKIKKEKVNLYEAAIFLLESHSIPINEKQVDIVNEIPESATIYIDENTLDLVLRNVFTNALKFCHKRDKIILSFSEDDQFTQVCIEDTGVGMSQEKANDLFKNRDLISAIGTGKEKGTGIGAVLAKEFLEENNGKIWVDYSEEGKGTRICFKVPKQ